MGVYIKGMKMPTACFACKLLNETYWKCRVHGEANHSFDHRPTDCPLVSVPKHGRLIDADALYRRIKTECNPYGKPTINFADGNKVMDMIEAAPTIIPASKEERA